jgi:DNA helicase-2/ATP-dependent DNA helicase PcrA
MDSYGSSYNTPGWQRAKARQGGGNQGGGGASNGFGERAQPAWGARRAGPQMIEGELVAKSTATSGFALGARVFHIKFGYGSIAAVDGNKLTVDFEKAGRKMVLDSFVQAG